MRRLAFLAGVALALGATACGAGHSIEAPASPGDWYPYDHAVVEAVRAYLHTFKLNETNLAVGLSIPFSGETWGGTANATGRTGPHGHEIYRVVFLPASIGGGFMEIAPEPTPVSSAPTTP